MATYTKIRGMVSETQERHAWKAHGEGKNKKENIPPALLPPGTESCPPWLAPPHATAPETPAHPPRKRRTLPAEPQTDCACCGVGKAVCHTTAATNRMRRHSLWMRTCTRGVMTGPMTTEKSPHCTPCHYLLPRTTTAGRARHQPVHPHIEDTTHNPQPVQVVADLSTNVCLPSRRKTHQDQDQFGVLLMKHVPNRKLGLRSTAVQPQRKHENEHKSPSTHIAHMQVGTSPADTHAQVHMGRKSGHTTLSLHSNEGRKKRGPTLEGEHKDGMRTGVDSHA